MSCNCITPRCGSPQQPVNFHCDNDGRDVEFVDLAEFLPRVTLVAKGVPDDVALEYIRQACQTLARDSRLLQRRVELDIQAGVKDYYLNDGEQEQVHLVHAITIGHTAIRKGGCFVPLKTCRSDDFSFEVPDKIVLAKAPKQDAEYRLTVEYLALPSQSCCMVDKLLYDRYHDVIVNGALSELLLMGHYDFAHPQTALLYEKRFKQGIAKAKIDVMQDFETGTQSLAFSGRI